MSQDPADLDRDSESHVSETTEGGACKRREPDFFYIKDRGGGTHTEGGQFGHDRERRMDREGKSSLEGRISLKGKPEGQLAD